MSARLIGRRDLVRDMKTIATNFVKGKPLPIIRTLGRRIKQHRVQVGDRNYEIMPGAGTLSANSATQENNGPVVLPSFPYIRKIDRRLYTWHRRSK